MIKTNVNKRVLRGNSNLDRELLYNMRHDYGIASVLQLSCPSGHWSKEQFKKIFI